MPYDMQKAVCNQSAINRPVIESAPPRPTPLSYRNTFKRLLDITLVLLSLPVVVPLILLSALLVMLDGHNPFYTQLRVGRNRKPFRIFKIRTMVPNADDLLEQHLARNSQLRAEWERSQKLKRDIRVTRIGRILRKTSLDELPQLWNVLNGSMSLVGPRPMMVAQEPLYPGRSYFNLRPGITGFWQVSDRHLTSFEDRALYDDHYDRAVSLGTDIRVLMQTVRVVLKGTGC